MKDSKTVALEALARIGSEPSAYVALEIARWALLDVALAEDLRVEFGTAKVDGAKRKE